MANRLKDLVPILMCDDTQTSIQFYCDVLGFTVVDRMDDIGKTGWASLRQGDVQIMLASPSYVADGVKVGGRYPQLMLYLYPEDVAGLREDVKAKGYQPSDLVVRFYGMKEFELVDPSGHVLVFGQETDEAPTPE